MHIRHVASTLLLLAAACRGDLPSTLPTPDAPREKLDVTASKEYVVLLLRTPSAPVGARGGQTLALDVAMDDHIQRIEGQAGRQVYVGVAAIR